MLDERGVESTCKTVCFSSSTTTEGLIYSHTSCNKAIAATSVGAGVGGAVNNAPSMSFGKAVSDVVGGGVGPLLGVSIGDEIGVAFDRVISVGVGDAVGVEFIRDIGKKLMAINTVNVKKQNIREK